MRSAGPVVTARGKHPIPSRTRPLSPAAPMVLHLKVWESRSPPNLIRTASSRTISKTPPIKATSPKGERYPPDNPVAGWSSPVARQAHNLKVVGSNPTPATNNNLCKTIRYAPPQGGFLRCAIRTGSTVEATGVMSELWRISHAKDY